MLLSGYEIPPVVRSTKQFQENSCRYQVDQSLVLAKVRVNFSQNYTAARKFNPQIITVIQPKRPPRKFSPEKNTRYAVFTTRDSCSSETVSLHNESTTSHARTLFPLTTLSPGLLRSVPPEHRWHWPPSWSCSGQLDPTYSSLRW